MDAACLCGWLPIFRRKNVIPERFLSNVVSRGVVANHDYRLAAGPFLKRRSDQFSVFPHNLNENNNKIIIRKLRNVLQPIHSSRQAFTSSHSYGTGHIEESVEFAVFN